MLKLRVKDISISYKKKMNETNIATTLELNGNWGNVKVSKLFMQGVLKWIQFTSNGHQTAHLWCEKVHGSGEVKQ